MEHYFVDLHTTEYPADETIIEFTAENADENLKLVCEKALYDKYGKDVPEFIILNKDDLSNQRKMFFEIALECCARDIRFDFSLYKYWSDTDLYHMSIFMPEGNIIHLPYYTNVNL